jgi:hypothetical protein
MRPLLFPLCAAIIPSLTFTVSVTACGRHPRAQAVARVPGPRRAVVVPLVSDEAEAALALLTKRRAGVPLTAGDWARFFDSQGYRRLKARELGMGRAFTDTAFRAFLLSDSLLRRSARLDTAVAAYERMNIAEAAVRALRYLPAGAGMHATLYLEVKPVTNSFVFDFPDGRGIFIYVDPARPVAVVEHDIVSHELHHIGYDEACLAGQGAGSLPAQADSSPAARARLWLGAFGEGLAMLAAAGGPDVDPHALSASRERARWQHDLANWKADFVRVEAFLTDVATGRVANQDSILAVARTFYGDAQGAWYTVGYEMAVTVEHAFGRERLVNSICDPRQFLTTYNEAAGAYNRAHGAEDQMPVWSEGLLEGLGRY